MIARLLPLLLVLCLPGAAMLHAQDCYQKALQTGDRFYEKGERDKAREAWEKAKQCPGADVTMLENRIRRMDDYDLDGISNKMDKCLTEFGAKETDGCPCAEVHRWLGIDNYYDNRHDSALVQFQLAKNCSDVKAMQDIEAWEAKIADQQYAYDITDQADHEIYKVVQEMPQYVGGENSLFKFIYDNVQYPSIARANGVEGTVFIKYIIEKDGHISHVEVIRDVGAGLGNEAARVVRMMPPWKPGRQNGKPVRVYFNLPVKYKLE